MKRAPPACIEGSSDEIVVCARRDPRRYRIDPLPPEHEGLGTAERTIGRVRAGIRTERGSIGSIPTNRVMVGIKIPL